MDPSREELKAALLEMIRDFFDQPAAPAARHTLADGELQLAAAALMVCLVRADRESRQDEHHALEEAIARTLGIDGDAAARLVRSAEERLTDGAPFAQFLRCLDRGCEPDQKKCLVESLWRIAFADAALDGHEEYLVRKVAEQLHLSTADLVETKVRAKEAFLTGSG